MSPNVTHRKDKQNLRYIASSGLAGGLAGCVAKTVVAPLDRVKILFQASNPDFTKYAGTWTGAFRAISLIYRDQGVLGLFQGHSATLIRIFPYAAIKFMAYDQVEQLLMPTREHQTNFRRFSAGAISGMISVFCTYPLELVRVRMAYRTRTATGLTSTSSRPSFLHAMSEIYREAPSTPGTTTVFTRFPILKFYRGFSVTLTGMIPYAGTSFLTWGFLRSHFVPASASDKTQSTPIADLTIGAVSGAIAQTVSYPFEVIRRRMQVGGLTHPDRWLHWGETVRAIYSARGLKGFYVGLGIGYLKIVPMTAVSFAVWQWGKSVLGV